MATHSGEWASSSHSPFSALPVALLTRILQHVPQQQRLARCALVSRDWAAAAAAGTLSVECTSVDSSKCMSVGAWIKKHGKQLESMQLSTHRDWHAQLTSLPSTALQLPCSELQQLTSLQLSGLQVHLPASGNSTFTSTSSSSSAPSQHMPKLQDLHLQGCAFGDLHLDAASLLQLGPFTAVAQLSLESLTLVAPQDPGSPDLQVVRVRRLPSKAVLGLLQHMPQLQRLSLGRPMYKKVWGTATFPPSITALALDLHHHGPGPPPDPACDSRRVPLASIAQQLGGLQELKLCYGDVSPAVLASLSQLLVLELGCCTLLPIEPAAAHMDSVAVLLAAVGSMHQLKHLEMVQCSFTFADMSPQSCSALTASSHLTYLRISPPEDQPLPATALQHMFPAGRLRPQLQVLSLSCIFPGSGPEYSTTDVELAGVLSVCPGLTSLDIAGALQPGDSCSALLQLPPTCRQLTIGGAAFGDSAVATVVQLTQLTKLQWIGSWSLTDAGVYQLTAMQGLQELLLSFDHGLSRDLMDKHNYMDEQLHLLDQGKPVWQQLRDKIHACPNDAAWLALLGQQQQENQQLQQQVQRLEQASAQQQQEARQLKQAVTQLQQELEVMLQCRTGGPSAPAAAHRE